MIFVKEYGEGVDRMYKELQEAGAEKSEYYTNAFMLRTVICNDKNSAIYTSNPAIYASNPAIQSEKPDLNPEKLNKKTVIAMIDKQKYYDKTKQNLLEVYASVITNQVFGAPEVKKYLAAQIRFQKIL